ncbi:MAG: MFS transporter [Clostridia bacterium]|nr:MFS transporter [Clostridia bacterium]
MQKLNRKNSNKLTALCSAAYFVSYLTRVNFAAVIAAIIAAGDVDKTTAGAVTTIGFITYGVGQLISGKLGDIINPKKLMFAGFILTALMNLSIPFCPNGVFMCIVWGINGFAQSLMWPPMVKIMKSAMTNEYYDRGCVAVSWGSTGATILIYLIAPLIITLTNWKGVFFVNSSIAFIMSAVWMLLITKIEKETGMYYPVKSNTEKSSTGRKKLTASMCLPLLIFTMLAIFFQGCLRDGITTWVPTYVSEVFKLGSEKSILSGVIVPLFSLASIQLASIIYNKMGKKPYKCAGMMFIVGVISTGLLALFNDKSVLISIVLCALCAGCMHGINLILVCMLPAIYADEDNMSTLSGTLNFTTYVGSAASTYGFALLSDKFGWGGTIFSWLAIASLGTLMCILGSIKAKSNKK